MYDPTEFVGNFWFGYVTRHCRSDYMQGSPLSERLNPLRYEIGFGRKRPCRVVWNRNAWLNLKWSNANWWLWKKHYRAFVGYPRSNHHWKFGPFEYTRAGMIRVFRIGPCKFLRFGNRHKITFKAID